MRVFDIDDDAHVLTGDNTTLVEVDPRTGAATELVRVPALGNARYLPGEHKIVLEHGRPPQLSVLPLRGKGSLKTLVAAPAASVELLDALPGRVVYRTNQRTKLEFDVVIRNVFMGEEQAVWDRGGEVREAAVSPDSRFVAVRLPEELVLVATMPETEDDHLYRVAEESGTGGHRTLHWLADSTRLIATKAGPERTEVQSYNVTQERWVTLVPDAGRGAVVTPSPDGSLLAVAVGSRISLHSAESGEPLRTVELPGPVTSGPHWSPNSVAIALSTQDQAHLLMAAKAELASFPVT
ncbi:WD40 repeat domain-containing protein [Labedaea rhizosphaerae]|uniref:WD40 repeat protein n=1 Tax=Labedaea rhizosphaerae TaxID=598644 RepID=A0A4R6SLM1_LABRH|nr:WD40 repeat domain-containing protein [Labedaea rhizosphaerae]TDQ04857.1 hypothetical protein EV186_101815 [Labedaea rhizosphaerae]